MAYDEYIAERIGGFFLEKEISFNEKRMFGGICFMVDDKMCCGTHTDKKTTENYLLCRIGESAYEEALEDDYCIPMDFTGRPMKGYVFVLEGGYKTQSSLDKWLNLCLDFNPIAKKSKKK